MAKKFDILDDETEFNPHTGAAKMPTNITHGRKPLDDYLEIPINRIIPFQRKGSSDFSKMPESEFRQLVETIKEDGVIEAVTVRYLADDIFELLAGETRWRACKEAGLDRVPCHVLKDCDDRKAARIFSITNMSRRTLTVRDRVNGWWIYWENTKRGPGRRPADVMEDIETIQQTSSANVGNITVRQIQKYHKIHSLIEPLLQRLDRREINLESAYNLAFLSESEQQDLCRWNLPVSEPVSEKLKILSKSGAWSEDQVRALTVAPRSAADLDRKKLDRSISRFKRSVERKVNPLYYARLDDIMGEALELYFREHPEVRLPEEG